MLSQGRAYFGIGAGWYEREATGLGIHFPATLSERFARLEETLQIATQMWGDDMRPFEGRYFHLEEPLKSPPPVGRPHPPILVGGDGERRTIPLVARYADAWNVVIPSPVDAEDFGVLRGPIPDAVPASMRDKLDLLQRHCVDAGRDFDAIEKTVTTYVRTEAERAEREAVIRACVQLSDLGFEHVILSTVGVSRMPGRWHPSPLISCGRCTRSDRVPLRTNERRHAVRSPRQSPEVAH